MEYITRGVCGQEGCRETRYYLDNGLWFCRRGHQQEGRQIEEDPEDYGMRGQTIRIKRASTEKSEKTYQGKQAHKLLLQIYQLILWKQSHALVHTRGFPAKFEHVVRDLWALRLQTLARSVDDADDSQESSEVFSSQAETDTEVEDVVRANGKKLKWPRLVDSIALCYVAALLMRLPVSVGDFYRMAMRGDIPFIRTIRSVPADMRNKLPQQYLSLLEPRKLLRPEKLHQAAQDLVRFYRRKFHMQFPALNWPILLFQYIRRLALPIEVYPAVKNLRELVGFKFTFPGVTSSKRQILHRSPETQLVSLIVVVTKLLFSFDKIRRYPVSGNEPTTQAVDWTVWSQVQRQFANRDNAEGHITRGEEILTTEKDVFQMDPSQLDDYMDWYENSWLDPAPSKAPNPLADLFPTTRSAEPPRAEPKPEDDAITEMLQRVMGEMLFRRPYPSSDTDIPRPGCEYRRYRTAAELPELARPFYETVADVAGIRVESLVAAVFQTEVLLTRWEENRRRREAFGEEGEEFLRMDDGSASDEEMVAE